MESNTQSMLTLLKEVLDLSRPTEMKSEMPASLAALFEANGSDLCMECSSSPPSSDADLSDSSGSERSSYESLKKDALEILMDAKCRQCSVLKNGTTGKCVSSCTIETITLLRKEFFSLSVGKQAKYIETLYRHALYDEQGFRFSVNGYETCESAFYILLGINATGIHSLNPTRWREKRSICLKSRKGDTVAAALLEMDKIRPPKRSLKFDNALQFIALVAESGDTVPHGSVNGENLKILPYPNVKSLYQEYQWYCVQNYVPEGCIAQRQTLRRAVKTIQNARFIRSKGSFQTCEVCNNLHELLRDTKNKWTQHEINVILSMKRLHLRQQDAERKALEKNISDSKLFDEDGNPLKAFIFSDGMTTYTGNTPQEGNTGKRNKSASYITNRTIGVKVVCGNIDTWFLYHTDNLVSGGANTMIEITRQAINDLGVLLREQGLTLPKELILQFDNCGENKNKTMFSWLSDLVDQGYFTDIYVYFLIVGHTHDRCDQYFSVLSKKKRKTKFVGSPLSLWNLYRTAHTKPSDWPKINRQIRIVRDYRALYKDRTNSKIKYFQIPHVFHFSRDARIDKTIMRYKLFSTNTIWLPEPPDSRVTPGSMDTVQLPRCALFNGREAICSHFGMRAGPVDLSQQLRNISDPETSAMSGILDRLEELDLKSQAQLVERFDQEDNFGRPDKMADMPNPGSVPRGSRRENQDTGYIIWLKDKADATVAPEIVDEMDYRALARSFAPNVSAEDDEDVEEDECTGKMNPAGRRATNKQLISRMHEMTRASKYVLGKMENKGIISVEQDRDQFHYDCFVLAASEERFYQRRRTIPSIAADVVAEISAEPVFEHVKKEFLKRVPVVRLDLDAREELNRSLLQICKNAERKDGEPIIHYGEQKKRSRKPEKSQIKNSESMDTKAGEKKKRGRKPGQPNRRIIDEFKTLISCSSTTSTSHPDNF